jgi:putative phosphoesterase
MKIFIASDIHGSAAWCRRMLHAYDREQADCMLLLGDILYHGPRNALPEEYDPMQVAAMLNERAAELSGVRGNCDAEIDQMVLGFPVMADYCLLFAGKRRIFATHGHVFNKDRLPPLRPGDILLQGHTHEPCWENHSGVYIFNPGSAAIPKNGSWHGYMTIIDSCAEWKSMDGTGIHRFDLGG